MLDHIKEVNTLAGSFIKGVKGAQCPRIGSATAYKLKVPASFINANEEEVGDGYRLVLV